MIVTCPADDGDRQVMREMLLSAFPEDTAEDADRLLDRFFEDALVLRKDETAVSMLFLIPSHILYRGDRHAVGYIYAGATHPTHRGRGYYRRLIAYARETAVQRGMSGLFLRPADDMLADSYRRMGFTVPMMCQQSASVPKAMPSTPVVSLTARQYRVKRCDILRQKNVPFVEWDDRVIDHCFTWCRGVMQQDAVGLLSQEEDGTVLWEWLGDRLPCGDLIEHLAWFRTVGNDRVMGLLMPFETATLASMPPIYMGYAME